MVKNIDENKISGDVRMATINQDILNIGLTPMDVGHYILPRRTRQLGKR